MDDVVTLRIKVLSEQVAVAERRLGALEASSLRAETATKRLTTSTVRTSAVLKSVAGVVGGALAMATAKATREWLSYDKAAKEVMSITSKSRAEFQKMRKDVLQLSQALGVDATDAAQGLYQAISAGVDQDKALAFLDVAGRAGIAGVTSLETSVNGLTGVINAFHLEASDAEEVADVLFTAVREGKTTFDELASTMAKATVPVAAAGGTYRDLLAVTVALTKQNVPTSEAMTQTASVIKALINPSKEMVAIYRALHVESGQALIQQKGLVGAMQAVYGAVDGNQRVLFKALKRAEAFNAVLGVSGSNAQTAIDAQDSLAESSGAMGKAYKTNAETLENALNSLKASAIALVETMEGSLGIIQRFSEGLRGIAMLMGYAQESAATARALAGTDVTELGHATEILSRVSALRKELEETRARSAADSGLAGSGRLFGGGLDTNEIKSELDQLRKAWGAIDESTQSQAKNLQAIVRLQSKVTAGTMTQADFDTERLRLLHNFDETQKAITEEQEKAAKASAADLQERKSAMERAQAEMAAEKEHNKELERASRMARDLATTEQEKLDIQIKQIDAAREAGRISEETARKATDALLEQRMALTASGGGGGGSGGGGGGTPASGLSLPGIDDPFGGGYSDADRLQEQEEMVRESYVRRREAILAETALTVEQRNALLAGADKQYLDIMAKAEVERRAITMQSTEQLFGDLASIANAFGKRGADAAKALAIAGATVKMYEGATAAYASAASNGPLGWLMAPIAAASALAAGAANIAAIRSTPMDYAFAAGGIVPGGNYSGDHVPARVNSGEMILNRQQQAELFAFANGKAAPTSGGGDVKVVVNNNAPGVDVSVAESTGPDGRTIDLIVARAVSQSRLTIASDIARGGNGVAQSLERTYSLPRGRGV